MSTATKTNVAGSMSNGPAVEGLSMSSDSREMVKRAVPGELAEQQLDVGSGAVAIWGTPRASLDNFDGTEREIFIKRLSCQSAAKPGSDHLNKTIRIKYWMIHEVQIVNKDTGEIHDCLRTVLVEPDGSCYAFVSEVIARAVRDIFQEFGTQTIDPPLDVQVKQKSIANGKRCYVLVPE